MVYSTKNLSIQDKAVQMKEKNSSFFSSFSFPLGILEGGERLGPTYPDRTP